jgi:diguanylate cyclase
MSIMQLDIDHFGLFNKKYDHLTGDEVLRGVVERMKSRVRNTDIVARWGGEEFAVYLPETNLQEAAAIAETIRAQIGEHPFSLEGIDPVTVTVSIGVAEYEAGMDIDAFVRVANHKMLTAKKQGRNRVVS